MSSPRTSRPVKIFTDPELLLPDTLHVPILVPFLGRVDSIDDPDGTRLDRYEAVGGELFSMAALPACDVAVLPFDWYHACQEREFRERAERFHARVRAAGKRMLVFCDSDSAQPVDLEGSVVFRTSLYASTRRPEEHAMPHMGADLLAQHCGGVLQPRAKGTIPRIGFRGRAAVQPLVSVRAGVRLALRRARRAAAGEPTSWRHAYAFLRARNNALAALDGVPGVETAFFRHRHFYGGSHAALLPDWARAAVERRTYVQNLLDTDYTLCVRGEGNFSMRLYETICMGRIPLFVDTDCVLPLDDAIDWRAHLVWVDWRALPAIGTTLRDFHGSVGAAEFVERQRALRALWLEHLTPEAFFGRLHRYL